MKEAERALAYLNQSKTVNTIGLTSKKAGQKLVSIEREAKADVREFFSEPRDQGFLVIGGLLLENISLSLEKSHCLVIEVEWNRNQVHRPMRISNCTLRSIEDLMKWAGKGRSDAKQEEMGASGGPCWSSLGEHPDLPRSCMFDGTYPLPQGPGCGDVLLAAVLEIREVQADGSRSDHIIMTMDMPWIFSSKDLRRYEARGRSRAECEACMQVHPHKLHSTCIHIIACAQVYVRTLSADDHRQDE